MYLALVGAALKGTSIRRAIVGRSGLSLALTSGIATNFVRLMIWDSGKRRLTQVSGVTTSV
jgi:hypothetical protein